MTEIATPSSPSRPNTGLLMQTLRHLEDHPEEWNQDCWETCFAGHTVKQAGLETNTIRAEIRPGIVTEATISGVRMPDGRTVPIPQAARELLNISLAQAGELFQGSFFFRYEQLSNESGNFVGFGLRLEKGDQRKMVREVIARILNESGMDQEFFDFVNDGSDALYNMEAGEVAHVAV